MGESLINFAIIVLIIFSLIILLCYKLTRKPFATPKRKDDLEIERFQQDQILEFVKKRINDFVNSNPLDMGLSGEEFERRTGLVEELRNAMKNATSGDIQEKVYLKQYIYDLLDREYGVNETNVNWIIPFNDPSHLTDQDRFDVLLYLYKQKHGFKALSKLIEDYQLDRPKFIIEDGTAESYIITGEEIRDIYNKVYKEGKLTYHDKLNIVVQRIYQRYKGFGVIDEIRDMTIDGVSGGVSGLPSNLQSIENELELMDSMKKPNQGHQSVWIFYKGKSIHLSFLGFESELELIRVCQNIYKYDSSEQLTETNGYVVNEMKDGSRVVVVRPQFSESWAFWVRKFDLPNMTLSKLFPDTLQNAVVVREMLKYLMKGAQTTAFTGAQGSGKSSAVMASVKEMYARWNLRIQELIFELHIRRLYPERNSIAFRETKHISGQKALDLQKKTDGSVNILGEVATDEVAAWMIQMSQVASLFTVFTHHATSTKELIWSLRNSLLKEDVFKNEKIAEEQVAHAVKWDIHFRREMDGSRFIERITEITPMEYDSELFDKSGNFNKGDTLESKIDALYELQREGYRRKNGKLWKATNVIEFRDGGYQVVAPISTEKIERMMFNMSYDDRASFQEFLNDHWGTTLNE
ncbi:MULTISPECIES: Flp pilus assembly complex ATPase component TadA [Paenibacillus]|uniref:Pilus assembly protein CpaF n=1 Tax=Paenibacillus lautus TaxID=1401 RepID=A0A385TZU7_PAELA|nr:MULTISPECIES: Flp pilus assembly complex ATPase component TadA [Paenibacillus]AWP25201.1 pilus assembly protein CpaF [Paenibacillus sp. Cedars]AYB48032.1 pilus assembly protein CpaF [Paenibacillus lautus]